jgi:acetyl esterase
MKTCLTLGSLFALATLSLAADPPPPKPTPDMQAVLDQLGELGGKSIAELPPEEARKQPSPADAVKALLTKRNLSTEPETVKNVEDKMIPAPAGDIPVRIYTPEGAGPFPVILYIHGGGWVIADLDDYDATPRALTNAAKAVVVSTHYRQAPEHPFPASHDDTFAAYKWVLANAASISGDPMRIAVAGESAGGNMAVGISLMARQQNIPLPVHQVLIYPVVSADLDTPSMQRNENAKPLSKAMMAWFGKHELQDPKDAQNPRFNLLNADLKGMPPTTLIAAEIDPLLSGGQKLAEKLQAAGVPVVYEEYPGVTHEFFGMGAVLKQSKDAVSLVANNLQKAFKKD